MRVQLDSLRKAYDAYIQEQELIAQHRKSHSEGAPLLEADDSTKTRKKEEGCCCVIV